MLESPPGVTMSRELFATVGKMVNARNEFKLDQKKGGRYMFNGVNVDPMGGNNVKIGENIYEITPSIQKALTETSYNFTKMSDDDILTFSKILNDINYNPNEDNSSTRQKYIKNQLKSRVQNILKTPVAAIASGESDEYESLESDLEGNGTKTIVVPSDTDEIWTRLPVLLGLKLAGHTDTLIEASQLLDALLKRGEIETEQQYRNAINKFKSQ